MVEYGRYIIQIIDSDMSNCDKNTMEVKFKHCNVTNCSEQNTNNSCAKEDTKPVNPEEEV